MVDQVTNKNIKLNGLIMFLIYFTVNFLFLTKYGIRQSKVPLSVLVFFFTIVNFFIYYFRNSKLLSEKFFNNSKNVYVILGLFTIAYVGFCHIIKDPYKLNIDRWQTLNFSLEFWLKGKYIYDTPNFLGNISSYLPGQLLLAVIFYLMGNVGYIQVAAILLFSYAVIKKFKNNFLAVQAIFLLGISLSYIYEAICKSDFISSFIFTASFILLWSEKFKDNYFKKPILLGICLGILCLTRSVVIVALILFLLKSFLKTDWSARIKMTLSFIITIIILLGTVLFPAKSFQYILDHNPLNLQGQSNGFVMLFFLTLTIIMSFYVKKISQVFIYSSIIIFVLMVSFLLEQYFVLGYDYQNNFFSTTYLASCLPFSIVGYCFSIKDEKINKI